MLQNLTNALVKSTLSSKLKTKLSLNQKSTKLLSIQKTSSKLPIVISKPKKLRRLVLNRADINKMKMRKKINQTSENNNVSAERTPRLKARTSIRSSLRLNISSSFSRKSKRRRRSMNLSLPSMMKSAKCKRKSTVSSPISRTPR